MTICMVAKCPHCGANDMGFTLHGEYPNTKKQGTRFVTGACNSCEKPVSALLQHASGGNWSYTQLHGDLLKHQSLRTLGFWPSPEIIAAPENVPDKVARSYVEAAESRQRRAWNAACASYRRTMELALKTFAPDIEAWKLEKRIDKLAAEHRITKDMQDWAHELRLDGNEALHGDEDATEEITNQMHHLTHFLLVYLYNIPQQIATVRARRSGDGESI